MDIDLLGRDRGRLSTVAEEDQRGEFDQPRVEVEGVGSCALGCGLRGVLRGKGRSAAGCDEQNQRREERERASAAAGRCCLRAGGTALHDGEYDRIVAGRASTIRKVLGSVKRP